MAPVDVYVFAESPPSRAVEMVLKMIGVDFKKHTLSPFKGEHMTPDMLKINPTHKYPFIIDGELKLNESRAIISYLANRYMTGDDSLYPKDPLKRAKVDEVLYRDMSLSATSASLFIPVIRGLAKELDPNDEKKYRDELKIFDDILEKSGHKFIAGKNLTIADISLAASLSMAETLDYDISEFKHLTAYIERAKDAIPNYQEVNAGPIEAIRKYVASSRA